MKNLPTGRQVKKCKGKENHWVSQRLKTISSSSQTGAGVNHFNQLISGSFAGAAK